MFLNHYAVWAIWDELPAVPKLSILVLLLVSVWTLISAFLIILRLRSIAKQSQVQDAVHLQHSLAALQTRSANLNQLISATFYFFGFVFFLALPAIYFTPESSMPVGLLIFDNILKYIPVASNAFFIFLILHSIQWFVSSRINALGRRLNS
jgi:hypothetical protein